MLRAVITGVAGQDGCLVVGALSQRPAVGNGAQGSHRVGDGEASAAGLRRQQSKRPQGEPRTTHHRASRPSPEVHVRRVGREVAEPSRARARPAVSSVSGLAVSGVTRTAR